MSERRTRRDIPVQRGNTTHGLDREFPLLWQMAVDFDFAERLGGCTSPLLAEADAALRELWMARNADSLVTK